MEDALQLEGYLLKEKSKVSRLHGLTGDINRRYFRIRTVEGSPELALCYFKNSTDSEVRGWIYLKDVTEIAEHQDTIILTSAARTLHLYAETRGKHNGWVTGLAELCPGAIKILGLPTVAGHITEAGQGHDSTSTRSANLGTKCTRRRTAADLEWNDEGGTPDRPSRTEGRLAQPAICETVDLGDCEERRCDDWDAEIDEQRRRAAAAVLALQVAVKEADEEAHVQSRALGDLKQRGSSDARRMGAKYPSPPGPPPAALIRKTRRASAGPIPWVAPAEALSPAPDNFISNDRITSNDRDDEVNALSHGSAVKGAR